MIIEQGTKLRISHRRKGNFDTVALRTFDSDTEYFYPVATLEYKSGMNTDWFPGEAIPCAKDFCTFSVL